MREQIDIVYSPDKPIHGQCWVRILHEVNGGEYVEALLIELEEPIVHIEVITRD